MANNTAYGLPPLPAYTLTPRPPMIAGVPDPLVQLSAPVIAYWVVSLFFHTLDTYDLCSKYRLHTPAEVLMRNHVTKRDVARDVILQQVIQTISGLALAYFDPVETIGREEYDVAVWAQRLRLLQRALPRTLSLVGVDALGLGLELQKSHPMVAGAVSGGFYHFPGFAPWELYVAKAIYWAVIPFIQFVIAILIVDTWQYFLHRAMHMNKFLYATLHSRHHRLYVPYAFGALYNHPLEGFLLDTLGAGLAYLATGMTLRQGLWFFTFSTIKTVDDHCGYSFPWDPLQHITSNNAAYHDIHHQSWGIKTNFSQPFFTFWDRLLGTRWAGGDVSSRYERARIAAQKRFDADSASHSEQDISTHGPLPDAQQNGGVRTLEDERWEDPEVKQNIRRSPRKMSGFDTKSLSDRVAGSLRGRSTPILHTDGVN